MKERKVDLKKHLVSMEEVRIKLRSKTMAKSLTYEHVYASLYEQMHDNFLGVRYTFKQYRKEVVEP